MKAKGISVAASTSDVNAQRLGISSKQPAPKGLGKQIASDSAQLLDLTHLKFENRSRTTKDSDHVANSDHVSLVSQRFLAKADVIITQTKSDRNMCTSDRKIDRIYPIENFDRKQPQGEVGADPVFAFNPPNPTDPG